MNIFDELHRGRTTASARETQDLAQLFAGALPDNVTLALHGNVGVGKTTFVQGLALGFGVREPVTSPTFNIYTVHRAAARTLVHLDAYRLENAQQVHDLLLEDFLEPPWCLAVEWPENIREWIPRDALHLELGITADQRHSVLLR